MTAVFAHPLERDLFATRRRAGRPWLATIMIFLAFLLATHDPLASQKWQKSVKSDVTSLGADVENGRVARQLGFVLLGIVGFALIIRRSNVPMRPDPLILFPFAMVTIWAFMSMAWSADPALTFKRQLVLLFMLLAVVGLIRQYPMKLITEMAFVMMISYLLVGIVAEVIFALGDDGGEEYRFAGTLHPNHSALNASFLLLSSLYLARRREDRRFLICVPLALLVVLMTRSRTALAGVIVGWAAFALAMRPLKQKLALIVAVAAVLAAAAMLVSTDVLPHLGQVVLLNRKNSDPTTLTGRTTVWHYVWEYLSVDWSGILAGFGYGGFWTKATAELVSQRAQFKLAEAHDDYLELMTQLGLVGLFLYLWGLLAVLGKSISRVRRAGSADAAFAIALIAFSLVHSIAESAMTLPVFTTLLFWSVLGSAALTWGNDRGIGSAG